MFACVFQIVPCVMLSHLQVLPLQPKSEDRAVPVKYQTVCWSFQQRLQHAAYTKHQAGPTNSCVTGTLPWSWGGNGSFAALISLEIGCSSTDPDGITGSLPSEWGSSEAFQLLQTLVINTCSITDENMHGFLGCDDAPPDCQCFSTLLTWCPLLNSAAC